MDMCCILFSGTVGLKPCWGKEYPEAEVLGISEPGEGRRHKEVGNASRFEFLLLLLLWAGGKGRREKSQNMELPREKLFQGKAGNVAVEKRGGKKRWVRTLEMSFLQPRAASVTHSSQGHESKN